MKRIFKFSLEVTDEQWIPLQKGADLLCVQAQNGKPVLYATIDDEESQIERVQILTHGTGHLTSGNIGQYLGTYQLRDGEFVGHCFKGNIAQVLFRY